MNSKIPYIDNLKVFLIALVVAHHAAQGYQIGVEDWLVPDPNKTKWLSLLISTNATYFMGLFFLISAYFLPSSYKKTAPGTLFQKKLVRLGIPTLCSVLFILPPTYYLSIYGQSYSFVPFVKDWFFTEAHFTFGHTWFIMQLLFYSSMYIYFKKYWSKNCKITLSHTLIGLYTLALFVSTWLVSLKFPQDSWYFYHLIEPYHLPQYISLFAGGIIAYENNWLQTVSRRMGYIWLGIGMLCFLIFALQNATNMQRFSPTGYILWSSVMCSSWCIGLLTLFRECCNAQGPFLSYLANNSYTVYLVHVLPVIAMQRFLLPYSLGGLEKFFITFAASYVLSYTLAGFIRLTTRSIYN